MAQASAAKGSSGPRPAASHRARISTSPKTQEPAASLTTRLHTFDINSHFKLFPAKAASKSFDFADSVRECWRMFNCASTEASSSTRLLPQSPPEAQVACSPSAETLPLKTRAKDTDARKPCMDIITF